ncbi:MAG: DUF4266 domain-containing protein [candidate division KSB1 bacterium]|nr:DUF4266 domain-containing protein [candidate division KSB1 bacterium]MDZ7366400.1 DUF4266 domain-containing protein [candidate division KSB1 bacterium]MDZ7404055.1 DUF4266 domain-containing protein [candidate division KSB1 bacterium]
MNRNSRFMLAGFLLLAIQFFAGGCAAVKPYERELLAQRIMDFDKAKTEEAKERHWLETLEGSTGGLGGSGGGCACN